jgi:hypothetical protein
MKHTRITDARAKLAASPGAGNFLVTEKVLQCVNPNGCAVLRLTIRLEYSKFPRKFLSRPLLLIALSLIRWPASVASAAVNLPTCE